MPLVLDASVVVALLIEDEELALRSEAMDRLLRDRLVVPAHWSLEVANALLSSERRGRITEDRTAESAAMLSDLMIEIRDAGVDDVLGRVVALARRHRLTPYDAAYLDIALVEGLDLVTLDRRLRRAALEAGVTVLE